MTIPSDADRPAQNEVTGIFQPAPGPAESGTFAASGIGANGPLHTLTLPNSGTPAVERFTLPGYDLHEELGRGGMGVVYRGLQTGLNRPVAVKMILSGVHASDSDRSRFRTEARAIARLHHPNIVQVYEVGEHDGKPYLTLEYCGGGSLEKQLKGTPLPAHAAATLIETLARAVHAAHDQRIVHRDLKPANILLSRKSSAQTPTPETPAGFAADADFRLADYEPKVTDFGLAKRLDEASQTNTGAVMGTPSYMAPEQAASNIKEIGPAVDVYALGAILYECLTGRPPFKAPTSLETILQVMREDPVPPKQLQSRTPRDLETICLKCLQKEPKKRYATALDFAEDLRRFRAGEPIAARPFGLTERGWRWVRRNPLVASLAAAIALLLLLAGVAGTLMAVQQSNLRETAQSNELAARNAETKAVAAQDQAAKQTLSAYETLARSYRDQAQVLWTSGVPKRQASALTLLRQSDQLRPSMEELLGQLEDRGGDWRERHDRFWFGHSAALNSEAMRWLQNPSLQRLDPPLRFQPPPNADTQSRQTGAFAVSSDGKWLARFHAPTQADQTSEVALWNLERRVQFATLPLALTFKTADDIDGTKHQYQVRVDSVQLAFSADGTQLLVARREIQREEGNADADQFALVLETLPLTVGGERGKPVLLRLKNEQMRTPRRFIWQADRGRVLVLPERLSVVAVAPPPVAVVVPFPTGSGSVAPLAGGPGVLLLIPGALQPPDPLATPPVDQLAVLVCDAQDGRLLTTLNPPNFAPLGLLKDGRQLYGLGWLNKPGFAEPYTLKIVDSDDGKLLRDVSLPATTGSSLQQGPGGGNSGSNYNHESLVVSPDGRWWTESYSSGPSVRVTLGDVETGQEKATVWLSGTELDRGMTTLVFRPDNRALAAAFSPFMHMLSVPGLDLLESQPLSPGWDADNGMPGGMGGPRGPGIPGAPMGPPGMPGGGPMVPGGYQGGGWHPYRVEFLPDGARVVADLRTPKRRRDQDDGKLNTPPSVLKEGETGLLEQVVQFWDLSLPQVTPPREFARNGQLNGLALDGRTTRLYFGGEVDGTCVGAGAWDLEATSRSAFVANASTTRQYQIARTGDAQVWKVGIAPRGGFDVLGDVDAHHLFDETGRAAFDWKQSLQPVPTPGGIGGQPGGGIPGPERPNLEVLDAVTGKIRQSIAPFGFLVASSPDWRYLAFAPDFTGANADACTMLALGAGHGAPPFVTAMNHLLAAHLVAAADLRIFDTHNNCWLLPFHGEEWRNLASLTFNSDARYVVARNAATVSIGRLKDAKAIASYPADTSPATNTVWGVRFDARSDTGFVATVVPAEGTKPAYWIGHIVEVDTGRELAKFDLGSQGAGGGFGGIQPGLDIVAGQPELSPDGKRVVVARSGNTADSQSLNRVSLWSEGDKALKPLVPSSWYTDVPTFQFNADGSRLLVLGTASMSFNLQERLRWQTACLSLGTIGLPPADVTRTAAALGTAELLPDMATQLAQEIADKVVLELWDLSGAPRLLASNREGSGTVFRYDLSEKHGTATVSLTSLDSDPAKARCEVWDVRTGRVLAEHVGVTTVEAVNVPRTYVQGTLVEDPQKLALNVVVDLSGKRKPLKLPGAPWISSAQAFSPDGRFMLASLDASGKGGVIWNLHDQKSVELPVERIDFFCFSADGGRLATFEAGKNEGVKLWDTTTGKLVQTVSPEAGNRIPGGPPGNCTGLRFTADGKILGLTVNGQRRLANVATGRVYKVLTRYVHAATVSVTAVHGEGDSGVVATASEDRTVGLWRAADGQYLGMLEGYAAPVRQLAFDHIGRRLLTRDSRGALVMWTLERSEVDGQPVVTATVAWQTAEPGRGAALAWSADDSRIATAGPKGVVRLWTADKGEPVATLDAPETTENLTSLAFSPDGKTVVGAGTDGVVRLWDTADGKQTRSWSTDQGEVRAVAIHPREDLIVTAGADVRLWKGKQLVLKLDRHTRPVNHVCWSTDGKTVVTAGEDGTVVVWNLAEMKAGLQSLGLGW